MDFGVVSSAYGARHGSDSSSRNRRFFRAGVRAPSVRLRQGQNVETQVLTLDHRDVGQSAAIPCRKA